MASSVAKIALGVSCGILLAAGALLATCTGCVALVGKNMADIEEQKKESLAKVVLEDVEGGKDGNFVKISGKVRNNSSSPVTFVQVGVELLDSSGKVLDTDTTYAVGGDALNPGSARSFDIMTPVDDRMTTFRYFVVN